MTTKVLTTPAERILTRKEFLDNMIAFYSEDPERRRSFSYDGNCAYRSNKNFASRCAIGRWITDENYDWKIEGVSVGANEVMKCLPEQVRNLGKGFLVQVQDLHDGDLYWTRKGLTSCGKQKVSTIRGLYSC